MMMTVLLWRISSRSFPSPPATEPSPIVYDLDGSDVPGAGQDAPEVQVHRPAGQPIAGVPEHSSRGVSLGWQGRSSGDANHRYAAHGQDRC